MAVARYKNNDLQRPITIQKHDSNVESDQSISVFNTNKLAKCFSAAVRFGLFGALR